MQEYATASPAVERPRTSDLLLGASHIDFGRVGHQDDDGLGGDPRVRAIDMGLEDAVEVDFAVIEEAIGGGRLGVTAASRRDAGGGMRRQIREDGPESLIQPLVPQVDFLHFIDDPGCEHDATPLTDKIKWGGVEGAPSRHFARAFLPCQDQTRDV